MNFTRFLIKAIFGKSTKSYNRSDFYDAEQKGELGENIINKAANELGDEYQVLKNVTLPTKHGTTQIDQIIVSRYGVFVVEVKFMKGWIFGSTRNKIWTQVIYGHKTKFQNPLRQNYGHKKELELLGIRHIHSLVVFAQNCTFKTEMPENVVYAKKYIGFIHSKTSLVFEQSEVERILSLIKKYRLQESKETNRKHVKYLKNKHRNN